MKFSLTHKIAGSFLLNAAFSFIAIVYALGGMLAQTRRIEQIASADIESLSTARKLRDNLLAQERIEKQFRILNEPELLDLLARRQHEFEMSWSLLLGLELTDPLETDLVDAGRRYLELHGSDESTLAESVEQHQLAWQPRSQRRLAMVRTLDGFVDSRQQHIDRQIIALSRDSHDAVRSAFFLVVLGMALGAPIGLSVIFNLHRSLGRLRAAVRKISTGSFELELTGTPHDEFGTLAREFREMGERLRELERLHIDANPLTHLPGNQAIERAIDKRVAARQPFAHSYIDLDNFKIYNDRYGYQAGNEVLAEVGKLISQVVREEAGEQGLVGHVGGDDYVVLTPPEMAEPVATRIIHAFEDRVAGFYNDSDRTSGKLTGVDRFGVQREFPLMSMSIAIVNSQSLPNPSPAAVSEACTRIKEHLKNLPGSNFMVDRRSAA